MGEAAWKLDDDTAAGVATETRRNQRANVYLSVDVFSGHSFWTGLTMNMSERGLFIATDNALPPVGSTVVLNFALPFDDEAIVALAEVRWARPEAGPDGEPVGIGLEFTELSGELLERIADFVTLVREPLDLEP